MSTPEPAPDHGTCWDIPAHPDPDLLDALRNGPFKGLSGPRRDELVAALRRETVTTSAATDTENYRWFQSAAVNM